MDSKTNVSRWWDLPAATLLVVALLTAASRLVVTNWTENLSLIQNLTFLGAIAGLAVGQSRFSPRLSAIFGLVYGIFAVPWQIGLTFNSRLDWDERVTLLIERLRAVIEALVKRDVIQDSILFLFLMAVLFWFLSFHAGYMLVRHNNIWAATLPTGLALLVINHYDSGEVINRRTWYLTTYLFFALVLVARSFFLRLYKRWQDSRTALPPQLGLDFIRYTLAACAVIVLLVWTAPALARTLPALEKASEPLQKAWSNLRDRVDDIVAPLRSSSGVSSDYYGSSVLLGRGALLSDTPVFTVLGPTEIPEGVRYYWRARVYDTYKDGQWFNTQTRSVGFDPEESTLIFPIEKARWINTFQFFLNIRSSTLYAPSQALWVSRPGRVEYIPNPDGTIDLSSFHVNPSLKQGQFYQVQASLTQATVAEMRAAGTDYPSYILERYLQLPSSITPRTRQLASEITVGLSTPYDKTAAIIDFLRNNIAYRSTIPSPPPGRDVIDWFLFDLKEGFCNYYATAAVVLLRSVGIPARWAIGYAQGEQVDKGAFLVLQRDGHSWPEVYFPGLGWVEFEPTTSQPVLVRLAEPPKTETGNQNDSSPNDTEPMDREEYLDQLRQQRERNLDQSINLPGQNPARRIAITFGLICLTAAMIVLIRRPGVQKAIQYLPVKIEALMLRLGLKPPRFLRLWARRASLPPLSKFYLEINAALSRLGHRPAVNATPAERAIEIGKLLPPAEPPAQQLVHEYQKETFGLQPANLEKARLASLEIRKLSYKALVDRLLSRFHRSTDSRPRWSA